MSGGTKRLLILGIGILVVGAIVAIGLLGGGSSECTCRKNSNGIVDFQNDKGVVYCALSTCDQQLCELGQISKVGPFPTITKGKCVTT